MNFGHHGDPAIDFAREVEAIAAALGRGVHPETLFLRISRAMEFRAGGVMAAVAAKDRLREIAQLVAHSGRNARQAQASQWALAAFGKNEARLPEQRALRLVEESIEAAQACGCDPAQLHKLIDFVFARPVGDLAQELGAVGLTLLLCADAATLSADDCERAELARVLAKPAEHFTARNQFKNDAGFKAGGAQ